MTSLLLLQAFLQHAALICCSWQAANIIQLPCTAVSQAFFFVLLWPFIVCPPVSFEDSLLLMSVALWQVVHLMSSFEYRPASILCLLLQGQHIFSPDSDSPDSDLTFVEVDEKLLLFLLDQVCSTSHTASSESICLLVLPFSCIQLT